MYTVHMFSMFTGDTKEMMCFPSETACPAGLQAVHVDAILVFAFPVQNVELGPQANSQENPGSGKQPFRTRSNMTQTGKQVT